MRFLRAGKPGSETEPACHACLRRVHPLAGPENLIEKSPEETQTLSVPRLSDIVLFSFRRDLQ
jgi:hypothetical protein